MDEILKRFPVLGQKIFKQLGDTNLAKSRKVGRYWHNFLDNESLLFRRRIQNYAQHQVQFKEAWQLVTKNVPTEFLKKLADAIEGLCAQKSAILEYQNSPLHVVVELGMVTLCKYIVEQTRVINPADSHGWTPLHSAVKSGYLEIVLIHSKPFRR